MSRDVRQENIEKTAVVMNDDKILKQRFLDMPIEKQQRLYDSLVKVFSKLQSDWQSKPENANKTPIYADLWREHIKRNTGEQYMSEIDDIRSAISTIAHATADHLHREEHFTIMLFAALWPKYSDRLLSTTGLDLKKELQPVIAGTEADEIRKLYLNKTQDFYADLLLTAPMPHGNHLNCTLSIDRVLKQSPITCICEFKYLTAFPTLPKKIARQDTYKLKVLGEYIRIVSGTAPHMEQFIVASRRQCKYPKSVDNLIQWFSDDEIKSDTKGVRISIVDVDGVIHSVEK